MQRRHFWNPTLASARRAAAAFNIYYNWWCCLISMQLEANKQNKQNLEPNDNCVGSMSCIGSTLGSTFLANLTKRFTMPTSSMCTSGATDCNGVLVVALASEARHGWVVTRSGWPAVRRGNLCTKNEETQRIEKCSQCSGNVQQSFFASWQCVGFAYFAFSSSPSVSRKRLNLA